MFPRRVGRGFGRFVGDWEVFWRKMGRNPIKVCKKYTISHANITIYLARNFVKPLAKANDLYYNIVKWSESGEKKIESTSRSQEILRKRRQDNMLCIGRFGLIGSYNHTIDSKNRLFLPAKQRDYLGSTVILTRGLRNCLYMYTAEGWENFISKIDNDNDFESNDETLYFLGNAQEADVDSQGRITVPQTLRSFFGIGKDVTIVGAGHRLEIWKTEDWEEFNNDKDLGNRIREKLKEKKSSNNE